MKTTNNKNSKKFKRIRSNEGSGENNVPSNAVKTTGIGFDYNIESVNTMYGFSLLKKFDLPCCQISEICLFRDSQSLLIKDKDSKYYKLTIGEKFKTEKFTIEKIKFIMNRMFVFLIAKDDVDPKNVYKRAFDLDESFKIVDNEIVHI